MQKLYEIRRQMGLPGKHPADLCLNKGKANCHNCGGACHTEVPGLPKNLMSSVHGSTDMRVADREPSPETVAEITRRVLEMLNK